MSSIVNIFNRLSNWLEVLIVVLVMLVSNYYLQPEKIIIKADGKGYYEYLPATFIYNDLTWSYLDTLETPGYYNHKDYVVGAIIGPKGDLHNKYFVGTSILMSPFFLSAHAYAKMSHYKADGFTKPYQRAMWYSALFYLWLGLYLCRKMLRKFHIKDGVIFLCQLLLVFATPMLHYITFEAAFSHVYSFATFSALLYTFYLFKEHQKNKHLFLFAALCALVFLIRPFNILMIPAVLLVFKNFSELKSFFKQLVSEKKIALLTAALVGAGFCFIQCLLWYAQKGTFIIDSYGNEAFDFAHPHFFDILFSYKKGLFTYSPVLFIGLFLATIFAIKKKKIIPSIAFALPFLTFTYVLSSWWSWWYGMSYGQRSFIDVLPLLVVPIAYGFNQLKAKTLFVVLPLVLVTMPITVIQNYQYKNYILHWDMMNKESYWEVFLKTDEKYRGVLWQEYQSYSKNQIVNEYKTAPSLNIHPNSTFTLLEMTSINKNLTTECSLIEFSGDISDSNSDAKIILVIKNEQEEAIYWNQIFTYHQTRGKDGFVHSNFQFHIDPAILSAGNQLTLFITSSSAKVEIKNGLVHFISLNEDLTETSFQEKVTAMMKEVKADQAFLSILVDHPEKIHDSLIREETENRIRTQASINLIKEKIRASDEWMQTIEKKAKDQGITVEEMVAIDAEYIFKNESQ